MFWSWPFYYPVSKSVKCSESICSHFSNKSLADSRAAEEAFVSDVEESTPGTEWERVARLCDFNPKSSKQTKDVSRMRSVLISLKQSPLVHWRETTEKHDTSNILISEKLCLQNLVIFYCFRDHNTCIWYWSLYVIASLSLLYFPLLKNLIFGGSPVWS